MAESERKHAISAIWDGRGFQLGIRRFESSFGRYRLEIGPGGFVEFNDPPTNFPHAHDFYETCLILNGKGEYRTGTARHGVRAGDVIIADPGVVHEISSFESRDLRLVFFTIRVHDSGLEVTSDEDDHLIHRFVALHRYCARGSGALSHMVPLLREANYSRIQSSHAVRKLMERFVLEMIASTLRPSSHESHAASGTDHPGYVERAVEFIGRSVLNPIAVDDVAAYAGTSARNLRRLFSEHLHRGILEEIQRAKVNFAAHQLLMRFGVTQVADRMGLENPGELTRMFKRHLGVTPKRYQLMYAPNETGMAADFVDTGRRDAVQSSWSNHH